MTLEELMWNINDSTKVKVFSELTGDEIASYDGKDSIPEDLNWREVTDIFVEDDWLCVEIDAEEEEE